MNEEHENEKKLLKDFPALYRMNRGFECGNCWFQLIHELSSAIESEARKMGLKPTDKAWPMMLQVKEKFGTLRFYVATSGDDEVEYEACAGMLSIRPVSGIKSIRQLVAEAEEKSAHICQSCGQPGTLRTDGYWRTLCDPCEANRKE